MRFAYADPPYPGQAYRYKDHPDYAGEVDHAQLIGRLEAEYPDGWALSTSARALRAVILLCPEDVEVCVWHVTNSEPPGNRAGSRHWCWEPVIVRGGRPGPVKTLMACGHHRQEFLGRKPPAFTRWVLELLGAVPADTIDDLYPGSGAVGQTIEAWRVQPKLPAFSMTSREIQARDNYQDRARTMARTHDPLF
jgi:hypothetical protein